MKNDHKLTMKQRLFCNEYVKTKQALKAYQNAYDTKTSNHDVQSQEANKLLKKPAVKARIAHLLKQTETTAILTAQQILEQLTELGTRKNLQARDRLKALELLGKYRKLFTDKMEVKGADGQAFVVASLSERLKSARERARIPNIGSSLN